LDINQNLPLTLREQHWRSLTSGLCTMVLEQSDRYSAAFSLEARHVFMDKRLIEFCLALPSEQKLHQGWTRMIMRRGLVNILPEMIQWRGGKTSMKPNFLHGLLILNRQLLDEVISNELDSIAEYVDIDCVRQTYNQMTSAEKVSNGDINTVWRAVSLALWLKHSQLTP
jgi:asparagine synthase (glutamine-hydrolysing)